MRHHWLETGNGWVSRKHVVRAWVCSAESIGEAGGFRIVFELDKDGNNHVFSRAFTSSANAHAELRRMLFDDHPMQQARTA